MKPARLALAGIVACAAVNAGAATVYRCGPDGKTYQQAPCADGQPVNANDPPSAEQRQAAQAAAKSDAKLSDQMERERHAREAAAAPAGKPVAAKSAASSASAGKATKKAGKGADSEPAGFTATVPKEPKAAAATAAKP
jgi:hypothetical protein